MTLDSSCEWKPVPVEPFSSWYYVSSDGRIYSKHKFREEKNVTLIIFEQMNKNGGDGCDGATVDRDYRA